MKTTTCTFKRIAAVTVLGSSLGLAAMGVGAGAAQAKSGPFTWCPGQSMERPEGPNWFGKEYQWDMNVCRAWYRVSYEATATWSGITTVNGSDVWDGDNPPPDPDVNCGLFFCPVPPIRIPTSTGSVSR